MQEIMDLLIILWPLLVFQFLLFLWAIVDLIRRRQIRHLPKMGLGLDHYSNQSFWPDHLPGLRYSSYFSFSAFEDEL